MDNITNRLIKIHDNCENKCLICNRNLKWIKSYKVINDYISFSPKLSENNLREVNIINTHGSCRRIYNNYKKLKTEYEWAKFEYDLLRNN